MAEVRVSFIVNALTAPQVARVHNIVNYPACPGDTPRHELTSQNRILTFPEGIALLGNSGSRRLLVELTGKDRGGGK